MRDFSYQLVVVADEADNQLTDYLTQLGHHNDLVVVLSKAPQHGLQADQVLVSQDIQSAATFWSALSHALGTCDKPRLVIRAGALLPEALSLRLLSELCDTDDPKLVGISPLSAQDPLLSVFDQPNLANNLDIDAVDQWVVDYAEGRAWETTRLLPSCALLPASSPLWSISADTDKSLYAQLKCQGAVFLAANHVYIDDSSLDSAYFALDSLSDNCIANAQDYHPLLPLRHALSELAQRAEAPAKIVPVRPVQLHLAHSWGGGLGRWVEDYIEADQHHNNLVLRPLGTWGRFGQTIALYRSAQMDVPLQTWQLSQSIASTAVHHAEYAWLLTEVVADYQVEAIMVSSVIGQSLDIFALGLPTRVVLHDFYPFCPAIVATYNSTCHQCDRARMDGCKQGNDYHRFFTDESNDYFCALRQAFLEAIQQRHVSLIAPSHSVVERYQTLAPVLRQKPITVIPHGLSSTLLESLTMKPLQPANTETLKVVVLGSLAPQKGLALLKAALDRLAPFCELLLLGCGTDSKGLEKHAHVTRVESFTKDELAGHLASFNPHVGLLLSNVPETFSYTLSELYAIGLPVVATDIGAFSERVTPDAGWLIPIDADALVEQLHLLHQTPELIEQKRVNVKTYAQRTAGQMCDEYAALIDLPENLPRYRVAKRSYMNPYKGVTVQQTQALYIDEQQPFKQIVSEFLRYTQKKVIASPRLPNIVKRIIASAIKFSLKLLRRL